MYRISLMYLFTFFLTSFQIAQNNLISPCPRLFAYETESKEPDKWYANLTLLSDFDTYGIWFRILLDKPALQLGNWFASVYTEDNQHFVLGNSKGRLKANVPKPIRIFVKYNTSEPPPVLLWYHINSRQVCPEEDITEATTTSTKPINRVKAPKATNNNGDDICGTIVNHPKPLITNGQLTNKGEFPWNVSIYYAEGIQWTYICGASLISKSFVITSANCVAKSLSSTPLNPDFLSVYLGKQFLKSFSNEGIQCKQISEIIIHPQYNGKINSDDIALLKLTIPAEFTNFVRPICLWQESPLSNAIDNKYGNIAGWGVDDSGKVTNQLAQAELLVVSQDNCLTALPLFDDRISTENSYCAGFKNGTSLCIGDSGGGMVFPKSNLSPKKVVWQLRGLVSIGAATNNENKCDSSNYVAFTDTVQYLDWIKNSIK